MGARDDEDGDGADDRVAGHPEREPDDRGDRGGAEREPEQPRGGRVGEPLRARRRALRRLDEAADARERGVVADRRDLDADSRIGRHGSGDDRVARLALDGAGLARDHRLVERGRALDDAAVGGHAGARAHDDAVAEAQVARRDGLGARVGDALGLVGEERGERVEGARGLGERAHLDPVAEEHDDDEEGELPPEVELVRQEPEARAHAGDEGRRDGERDEQHHARFAGLELVDGAREERAAAPDVDDGAEDGRDPLDARDARELVAQDRREHRAEGDDGDGEEEVPPEEAAELGDMVAVTGMASVRAVRVMTLLGVVRSVAGALSARRVVVSLVVRVLGVRAHAGTVYPPGVSVES